MLLRILIFSFLLPLSTHSVGKDNLVLLPIDVSEVDIDLEAEYGSALQEGLQQRYTVFYGSVVEEQLEKEYSKIDCDTDTCNQNLAIAFNGELIADASVKGIDGGYLLKLAIRNVLSGQLVETKTLPCKACDRFKVVSQLKALGAGAVSNTAINRPVDGEKAIVIFDSNPTAAKVIINGVEAGNTPYQGVAHKVGELLNIEILHASYKPYKFELLVDKEILQLPKVELVPGLGQALITVEPFKQNAVVYVDGAAKGIAPMKLQLTAGLHQFQINHNGRLSEVRSAVIEDSNQKNITIELIPLDEELGIEFSLIPSGSYFIGESEGDTGQKSESLRKVDGFKLSKAEVTVAQFERFVADTGYQTNAETHYGGVKGCNVMSDSGPGWHWDEKASWKEPGFAQGPNHPVVCLSRKDVDQYISWLSRKSGESYRLPTEVEWEYAARSGGSKYYQWQYSGDQPCNHSNASAANSECKDEFQYTSPVAAFKSNSFDLFDMQGNVQEWVGDCWRASHDNITTHAATSLTEDCSRSGVRGGSWAHSYNELHAAKRSSAGKAGRSSTLGFRLVKD